MTNELAWWLRYQAGRGPERSLQLSPGAVLTIGRGSDSGITLDDPDVSRLHARLEMRAEGVWIKDLGSGNGTYIDGQRITSHLWKPGQTLRLGAVQFELKRGDRPAPEHGRHGARPNRVARELNASSLRVAWRIKATRRADKEHAITIPTGKSLSVGRDPKSSIVLDDSTVSRRHARIVTRPDGARVQDLNSENGTIIDGKRISEGHWSIGQRLEIGDFVFSLGLGSDDSDYDRVLSARNLRRRNRNRIASGYIERLRIFVSYSRRDMDVADKLAAALEKEDLEVIVDRRDLPYGEEWQRELADFIRNSDTVLFLVSANSLASQWCKWELAQVRDLRKRLFPLAIATVAVEDLPEELGRVHILPQQGIFDFAKHLPQLVSALNTDRAWVKEHTRLADWAREWRARGKPAAMLLRGPALEAAEIWKSQRPKTEQAAEAVVELIEASRRGRVRRRFNWAAAGAGMLAGGLVAGWMYHAQHTLGELANLLVTGLRGSVAELKEQLAVAKQETRMERDARREAEQHAKEERLKRQEAEQRVTELEKERANLGKAIDDIRTKLVVARRSNDKKLEDDLVRELRGAEQRLRIIEDESRSAVDKGRLQQTFTGHAQPIYALAIDPGGDVAITGSRDNTAAIWDVASGKRLTVLRPHHGDVLSVAITPDGKHIVTGSEDKRARLWTRSDGKQVAILAEHTSDVTTVAVTPDNQRVITGSADRTILIWDIATRKRIGKIEGHEGQVNRVRVTPDGRHIVSGSADKTLRIWDASTLQEIAKLDGRQLDGRHGLSGDIVDVAIFRYDGDLHVISASADNTVRIWKLRDILEGAKDPPPPLYSLNVLERGITSVAVTPDGTRVVVALADKYNSVWIWDFVKDTIVSKLEKGHEERVLCVAVFPDGRRILTGSADKSARVWTISPDN
jgi:pSer/pThr/pTyr-binding forkhead associated (FHA) protein/DNA-binding beta-propeller fold protein YncE